MIGYALFLASLKRRAKKDFLGPTLFYERKIVDFPFKKNVCLIDFLQVRLLSAAKNSA